MPKLIAVSPEFSGQQFELKEQTITVGRVEDNTISLSHPSVSSHHAELRLDGGDYRVVDLNSTNGTRINDERITEALLRNNDVVMFGNIILNYASENALSAPPLPEAGAKVDLSATLPGGRPAGFTNLAPFAKVKSTSTKGSFPMMILLAAVLALAGAGFLAYKLFLV